MVTKVNPASACPATPRTRPRAIRWQETRFIGEILPEWGNQYAGVRPKASAPLGSQGTSDECDRLPMGKSRRTEK